MREIVEGLLTRFLGTAVEYCSRKHIDLRRKTVLPSRTQSIIVTGRETVECKLCGFCCGHLFAPETPLSSDSSKNVHFARSVMSPRSPP